MKSQISLGDGTGHREILSPLRGRFSCKILSLLEYNSLVPAQGPSRETCPQEEFCSQEKELYRGLLCKVTCHVGL